MGHAASQPTEQEEPLGLDVATLGAAQRGDVPHLQQHLAVIAHLAEKQQGDIHSAGIASGPDEAHVPACAPGAARLAPEQHERLSLFSGGHLQQVEPVGTSFVLREERVDAG